MSFANAKRALQWQLVMETLSTAGVGEEVIAIVEHAKHVDEIVQSSAALLLGHADAKQAKNYESIGGAMGRVTDEQRAINCMAQADRAVNAMRGVDLSVSDWAREVMG